MRIINGNRYSVVTSTLALVIALGGTSYAAAKVTGDSIADGTVTTADIKDNNLQLQDFSATARDGLKGDVGPTGPQGDQGEVGPAGPRGTARAFSATISGSTTAPEGTAESVLDLPLDAGSYALSAKVQATDYGTTSLESYLDCDLVYTQGPDLITVDISSTDQDETSRRNMLVTQGVITVEEPTVVSLLCRGQDTALDNRSMMATSVDSTTKIEE
ncbi:collagen-like protein [Nocardioides agariphilus]|jgi:hypothetical protein|uniref:Collagen-like protein n=1 Tax=Nocardioides agariphilus TaxID=433664 RepID=A0A930VI22_9ACTN|nr:collagen-like protein [Nocardioides agariphilus]MBF4767934.1 collagen-like protein [Nocardioides agariphilus]